MSLPVTNSTRFLGLDIGKSEHAYAIVDLCGEVVARGTTKTDKKSLASFVSKTRRAHKQLIVGAEATGHYHESVARAFLAAGIQIQVVNPQLTTTKAIRSSVRSVKTDASDAIGIAQKLREKRGAIGYPFTWDAERRALQALGRSYNHLQWQRQSLRMHLKVYSERGLDHAYAPRTDVLETEIARVRGILIAEASRVFPREFAIMIGIRGIGEETAAKFLAETMGMDRFRDGHALAAFAGLDPRVKQSGTSIRGKGHITKTGSPILRNILGWTGKCLVMWNEPFRKRFAYDVERGKPLGVAYGSIARRLAVILHACLTRQVEFDPALVGASST